VTRSRSFFSGEYDYTQESLPAEEKQSAAELVGPVGLSVNVNEAYAALQCISGSDSKGIDAVVFRAPAGREWRLPASDPPGSRDGEHGDPSVGGRTVTRCTSARGNTRLGRVDKPLASRQGNDDAAGSDAGG
jgi:hypothetical protein